MTMLRIAVVLMALLLTACTGKKGASAPSAALLNPVGEQTAEFASTVTFDIDMGDSIVLNQYIGENSPLANQYLAQFIELTQAFEYVVDYSVATLDLAEVRSNEASIEQLIANIENLSANLSSLPTINEQVVEVSASFGGLQPSMREQKSVIKALAVASPVVNGYSSILREMVVTTQSSFDAAVEETYNAIGARHDTMLGFRKNVIERQDKAIIGLQLLDEAAEGDQDSWNELVSSNKSVSSVLGNSAGYSTQNIAKAEEILIGRLETVQHIREQLIMPYTAYSRQLAELYVVEDEGQAVLRLAYLLVDDWDRSQRLLAAGEPSSFKRATSTLWKIAYKKAISY